MNDLKYIPAGPEYAYDLTVSKHYQGGIKVDLATPTFSWRDMKGPITSSTTGANRPTLTTYAGNIEEWAFAAGDKYSTIKWHIDHDWAGQDMYTHIHWSHNGTDISGNLVVTYYVRYAKGHGRGSFSTEKTVTQTISGLNITNTASTLHRIDEVPLSIAGGSASLLDTAQIEPDGMILINFVTTTIPTITGGAAKPFVHFVDGHYQSSNIGTKNRVPDFYT